MARPKPLIHPLTNDDQRLAGMLKALGNPIRFQIVQFIAQRQMCITGDLVESTALAQSTVSQHLKVLREAELITGEIEGPATCYCLNADAILWLKDKISAWLPDCCTVEVQLIQISGESNCC